jgi:hypothetical protein
MSRREYMVQNGAMPTTARIPLVTTGTSIKTMLQVKPTTPIVVVEWGFSFATAPLALVSVELLTTGTVGVVALTDYVANDITKWGDSGTSASLIALTAEASGYTSSSTEGTITASRVLDYQPTWAQSYSKQWPLDREPSVAANDFLRIRVTTATAIDMNCWICWEE